MFRKGRDINLGEKSKVRKEPRGWDFMDLEENSIKKVYKMDLETGMHKYIEEFIRNAIISAGLTSFTSSKNIRNLGLGNVGAVVEGGNATEKEVHRKIRVRIKVSWGVFKGIKMLEVLRGLRNPTRPGYIVVMGSKDTLSAFEKGYSAEVSL